MRLNYGSGFIWCACGWDFSSFPLGILPGGGGVISSILPYGIEIRISTPPERFEKGAIERVAALESANDAATFGALLSFLTLGIPPKVVSHCFSILL